VGTTSNDLVTEGWTGGLLLEGYFSEIADSLLVILLASIQREIIETSNELKCTEIIIVNGKGAINRC